MTNKNSEYKNVLEAYLPKCESNNTLYTCLGGLGSGGLILSIPFDSVPMAITSATLIAIRCYLKRDDKATAYRNAKLDHMKNDKFTLLDDSELESKIE